MSRVNAESDLLEQELIKYVTQMEFELKNLTTCKSDIKLDNIDMKHFRKLFTTAKKSCSAMVESLVLQSEAMEKVLPKAKAQKQKKRK